MTNPNVTRNQLWQKKLLNDLPDRQLKTFGVDAAAVERLASEPGVYSAETEHGVVIGQVVGDRLEVHYAYETADDIRVEFTDAFLDVEEQAAANPAVQGVELQVDNMTSRAAVEIILKRNMFRIGEDWLLMGRRLPVEPGDDEPSAELEDGVRFRAATTADIPGIAALESACYGDAGAGPSVVEAWFERAHGFALIERSDEPIAFAASERREARAIVRRLGVLPGERRKGYGRGLFERIVDRMNREGARRAELVIFPNPATIGFARACRLAQQGAGVVYRKKLGEKYEPTGMIIRGTGWSDMRR